VNSVRVYTDVVTAKVSVDCWSTFIFPEGTFCFGFGYCRVYSLIECTRVLVLQMRQSNEDVKHQMVEIPRDQYIEVIANAVEKRLRVCLPIGFKTKMEDLVRQVNNRCRTSA